MRNESDRIYLRGLDHEAKLARYRSEKYLKAGNTLKAGIQLDIAVRREQDALRYRKSCQ